MQEITELKKLAGNYSILVVLNDDSILEQTLAYVQTIFIKIFQTRNAQEALELYKQKKPDIIVTGLDLGNMSGLELIQNIKKLDKFLPIIVLNKEIEKTPILELVHIGIQDLIIVPFKNELLHNAIIKSLDWVDFMFKKNEKEKISDEYSPIEALNDMYKNNMELQLISNYKGIPIIHMGKIVEIYKDIVQIQTRKIQTKAIAFSQKTILESPFLPKDIEAHLVDIDSSNAEVSLSNLKYIEYTPKRRKHARLLPSDDMKLMAYKKGGAKLNVELKDISLNNLTFEIKTLPDFFALGIILDLKIAFNIPESDLAYYVDKLCIINFQGKIIKMHEENAAHLVCVEFEMPKLKEDIFNQYIYQRELSIIKEFKEIASKKS